MAGDDFLWTFGPGEWLWVVVAVFDPVFNRRLEFRHAGECASPDALAGDFGEQPFDEIEPRAGCRREVNMEAGMALEPSLHGGGFVGGVIVGDEVKVEMGGGCAADLFQERQKLGGAMAGQALADDRAARHIEGGKQRCRTVTLVIMGHGAGPALLHGKAWLGAVEGLDLALLIDAEHQRLVGRIEIKSHDVLDLFGKIGIVGDFEAAHQMRFKAVFMPDTLDARVADAHLSGHRTHAPVRGVDRPFLDRLLDDLELDPGGDRLLARRLGAAFEQARGPGLDEIILPAPDRGLGDLDLAHDRRDALSPSRQKHDLRPLDDLLRRVSVSYNPLEPGAIFRPEYDFNSMSTHPDNESDSRNNWIQKFVTEH